MTDHEARQRAEGAVAGAKRDPHERRPRAPDYWELEEAAEIGELPAASGEAAGGGIAA